MTPGSRPEPGESVLMTVDGLFEFEGYKAAWFRDSEGNTLELSEVPAEG